MELRQIKYFIEVARREHVTEAALALHIAQSAVSRQIDNLEKELGVDLFIRDGRNVKLTPIGKIFLLLEHAARSRKKTEVEEYGTRKERCTLPEQFGQLRRRHFRLPFQYPTKFHLNQGAIIPH